MTDRELLASWDLDILCAKNIGSVTLSKEFILAIDDFINRQKAEIERLEYTLLGVMHSVDKWLEGDELKQDEVNRAATMREKTLQIVERLENSLAISKKETKRYAAQYQTIRSDVAKEFAERLKSKHRRILDYDEAGFSAPTDIVYVETIDNLVKEFTEETK